MIITVNMTTKQITKEETPKEYQLLGGRSLTSRILMDKIDPNCEPLGPRNKLVIAPGLIGGTYAPCSGRLSIGAKSPLTGGIKESNSGGTAATKLAKLGIKAIIIEGQPGNDCLYILKVDSKGVEICPADDIKGKSNYEVMKFLSDKYGADKAVIAIGPAGEMGYAMATVAVSDLDGYPTRHCGRGGMGAVLGAKGIKAIVIDDKNAPGVTYNDQDSFKNLSKEWAKEIIKAKKVLTDYGTANLVKPVNAFGGLPTRNFSSGTFEGAEKISGERLRELILERGGKTTHACQPGCVIRCSNVYNDENGNYLTAALEYETIGLVGSNCGIDSLDIIAKLDRFCDDFGIDTMEFGDTMAVVMESGILEFGDGEGALKLSEELKEGTLLGRLMGQGTAVTGKVLGVKRIPTVKGQGISAYDPRALKGTGVTYATSPMGADHTAGNALPGRYGYRPETKDPAIKIDKPHGQVELSKDLQFMSAVCDLTGLCFFVGATPENMEVIAKLINYKHGTSLTAEDVIEMGKQVIKTEVEFNKLAGITNVNNGLPEFFLTEKLSPNQLVFDVEKKDLEKIFDNI